ncbi:MAG: platelet-activating factor acetylhydrolase IB subunit [Isosphaeraceae bacterium]
MNFEDPPLIPSRWRWLGVGLLGAVLGPCAVAICAQNAGEHSAIRPEPREGAAMDMHRGFLERAKQGNVDLLFLGDSITAAWEGRDGDGLGPAQVWDRHYAPRNAANFGIGGDRTQHVLWRLGQGEVDGIQPRVVVLLIGTNNLSGNTPEEIVEGITAIVRTLKVKLPETKILLLGIFPRGEKPNPLRDRIAAVNARIKGLDDGGKTVKYLEIGHLFLNEDGTISRDVMPDALHLTRKAYRIWADAMEPTLWEMLEGSTRK